jgi:hypothetical protein
MQFIAGCLRPRLAALAIATSWLAACATGGSERPVGVVCLPVVDYSAEFQVRAAEELSWLPEASAIVMMPSDYAVMREQARACRTMEPPP